MKKKEGPNNKSFIVLNKNNVKRRQTRAFLKEKLFSFFKKNINKKIERKQKHLKTKNKKGAPALKTQTGTILNKEKISKEEEDRVFVIPLAQKLNGGTAVFIRKIAIEQNNGKEKAKDNKKKKLLTSWTTKKIILFSLFSIKGKKRHLKSIKTTLKRKDFKTEYMNNKK